MLSSNEPLLSSPYQRNASPCRRPVLLITLSSAALLCAGAAFLLLNLPTPDLCASSPDPTSCHAIVADAVLASPRAHLTRPGPAQVLRAIVARSLVQHDAAAAAVSGMLRHTGSDSDPRQRAALADCVQLMDLARDRLADASPAVAAAAADDARTWLSAALTYYATCTDGVVVDGPLRDAVVARLEPLKSLASASLAVLSAVVDDSGSRDAGLADTTYTFPSWVPARDRALLEAGAAIEADVVVAQDGSGKFRTVKEAVDAAPDGGKSRYVIYVKKGVYKENVEVGKKKRELMIVGDGMDATVITGSRNVVDGATTFNSATLGDAPRQCPVSPLRFQYSHSFPALYAANIRLSSDFAFTFGSLTIP